MTKSNYKYLAFEVIARIWESQALKANPKERKFPTGYSKHLPGRKLANMNIWVSWLCLGTLRSTWFLYFIGMSKKEYFSLNTEHSTSIYCRLWIWCASSEQLGCSTLSLPLLPLGKWSDAQTLGQGLVLSARLMCSSICTQAFVAIRMWKWGYSEPGAKK